MRGQIVSNERDSAQGAVRLGPCSRTSRSLASNVRPNPNDGSLLLAGSSACFVIVIVTHIAEALRLFPAMGWGEPRSIGHYVDLTSAIGGIALLALSVLVRIRAKIT